jgi:hypothetical protein
VKGLLAASRLSIGRADGVAVLDGADSMADAARSFRVAGFCVPLFIAMHLLDWAQSGAPRHMAIGFAADGLGYVIGWAGFALASHRLADMLGRQRRWPRFIILWNWCNLIQYLMLMAAALPALLGLPDAVAQLAWLVAMGWAVWFEWFATRLALEITGAQAAAMVALDVLIGLFLAGLSAVLAA